MPRFRFEALELPFEAQEMRDRARGMPTFIAVLRGVIAGDLGLR